MKTPEEIKRGLQCCTPLDGEGECTGFDAICRLCPYDGETWCADKMRKDALTYIAQIETQLRDAAKLQSDRDAWQRRAEAAERDLLKLMKNHQRGCNYCKHREYCTAAWDECAPEWRGPCAEDGGESHGHHA